MREMLEEAEMNNTSSKDRCDCVRNRLLVSLRGGGRA
jgi:hypothetical protein